MNRGAFRDRGDARPVTAGPRRHGRRLAGQDRGRPRHRLRDRLRHRHGDPGTGDRPGPGRNGSRRRPGQLRREPRRPDAPIRPRSRRAKSANPADTITPANFVVAHDGTVTLTLTRPIHTLVAHYLPIPSVKTATGDRHRSTERPDGQAHALTGSGPGPRGRLHPDRRAVGPGPPQPGRGPPTRRRSCVSICQRICRPSSRSRSSGTTASRTSSSRPCQRRAHRQRPGRDRRAAGPGGPGRRSPTAPAPST